MSLNISSILTPITSFLGGIQSYLIVGAVSGVLAASAASYVTYRVEQSTIKGLQLAASVADNKIQAHGARIIAVEDKVALDAALAHQVIEDHITIQTAANTEEITRYVHDKISCPGPTVGLARVLRAYSQGIDPSNLDLAPGQSDDDCSDVSASEVAGWFNQYADAARKNAQQLNDLETWIAQDHKAQETTK